MADNEVPTIRDKDHLNELIRNAEGDDDLAAIKQQMQKQGMHIDSPAFRGLPLTQSKLGPEQFAFSRPVTNG